VWREAVCASSARHCIEPSASLRSPQVMAASTVTQAAAFMPMAADFDILQHSQIVEICTSWKVRIDTLRNTVRRHPVISSRANTVRPALGSLDPADDLKSGGLSGPFARLMALIPCAGFDDTLSTATSRQIVAFRSQGADCSCALLAHAPTTIFRSDGETARCVLWIRINTVHMRDPCISPRVEKLVTSFRQQLTIKRPRRRLTVLCRRHIASSRLARPCAAHSFRG